MPENRFPCSQCGGELTFSPADQKLTCPYCGHRQPVPTSDERVEELRLREHLSHAAEDQATEKQAVTACDGCGAELTLNPDVAGDACPYCGAQVAVREEHRRSIRPNAVLPFQVTLRAARSALHQWIRSRWFAPNDLKRHAGRERSLQGVYVPYWTYDCDTVSHYQGQRGDDYWTTHTYTAMVNGKPVARTRRVKRTRWHSVSGTVRDRFDDILVPASGNLPREQSDALAPWDLHALEPYAPEYASGFRVERYQRGLIDGFAEARQAMHGTIRQSVRRDIGGDHQRVNDIRVQHRHITFKHILLPVWLSAYRYGRKVYRLMVNARTGEAQGERPWSWVKIALAVLAGLVLAAGITALIVHLQAGPAQPALPWSPP